MKENIVHWQYFVPLIQWCNSFFNSFSKQEVLFTGVFFLQRFQTCLDFILCNVMSTNISLKNKGITQMSITAILFEGTHHLYYQEWNNSQNANSRRHKEKSRLFEYLIMLTACPLLHLQAKQTDRWTYFFAWRSSGKEWIHRSKVKVSWSKNVLSAF